MLRYIFLHAKNPQQTGKNDIPKRNVDQCIGISFSQAPLGVGGFGQLIIKCQPGTRDGES